MHGAVPLLRQEHSWCPLDLFQFTDRTENLSSRKRRIIREPQDVLLFGSITPALLLLPGAARRLLADWGNAAVWRREQTTRAQLRVLLLRVAAERTPVGPQPCFAPFPPNAPALTGMPTRTSTSVRIPASAAFTRTH